MARKIVNRAPFDVRGRNLSRGRLAIIWK
ncbi:hypothetical protein DSM3645_03258 [Blastopirellula marina DSM 3645]|uniref:Uncharacterized protein n=1 Tax=Blastopirellula marina DSM 3645 TaxID=314230 RepID=A3ZVW5_9BACT|nr:hypothetical protein DSM3645_03258 [Blastopirellula marina DSM 3645]